MQLTTINPVLVSGVPLDAHYGSSVSVVERLLSGKDPVIPDISFSLVDVKDVAAMHVKAISNDAAKGQRFIAASGMRTFMSLAKTLKAAFPGRRISTIPAPTFVIRFLALFDGEVRAVLPTLGKHIPVDSSKAQKVLGIKFISVEDSLVATAKFLIEAGAVKK